MKSKTIFRPSLMWCDLPFAEPPWFSLCSSNKWTFQSVHNWNEWLHMKETSQCVEIFAEPLANKTITSLWTICPTQTEYIYPTITYIVHVKISNSQLSLSCCSWSQLVTQHCRERAGIHSSCFYDDNEWWMGKPFYDLAAFKSGTFHLYQSCTLTHV